MEKLLRPSRLDIDPNSSTAANEWRHWHKTFTNFIEDCTDKASQTKGCKPPNKLRTLINCVSHSVYQYIEECTTYDDAISTLKKLYVKTPNEIFARHLLATRRQKAGESLDDFLRELRKLGKDCNMKSVTAEQYRQELIRDAFINGLASPLIRQRLLENKSLDLDAAYNQAYSLDLAQRNAESYINNTATAHTAAAVSTSDQVQSNDDASDHEEKQSSEHPVAATYNKNFKKKCYFCGANYHDRTKCPAQDNTCNNCQKVGHYAKVCKSKQFKRTGGTAAIITTSKPSLLAITASYPSSLSQAAVKLNLNGQKLEALMDSCSSDSFISEKMATKLKLQIHSSTKEVSMASTTINTNSPGYCVVKIKLNGQTYPSTRLSVLKDLCCDLLLGQDFQKQHESLTFEYGGDRPPLKVSTSKSLCGLSAASVSEPSLFPNLPPNCKPIATKSRRFSNDDQSFIKEKVSGMVEEGIAEECKSSSWRAQVVIVKDPTNRHRKRLCVDYSQTINQYTELDAYPLPRIDDMIDKLAGYKVFSTFDLKSAYHQIPIAKSDRHYTAFEANGRLYQFCRIPFGVTNGVSAFQRAMDKLVDEENLKDTFPYLDNITIAGKTQAEHDENVNKFLEIVKLKKLTLNESKTVHSVPSINVLGYCVGNGVIKPDQDRLKPLQDFPPPTNANALRRALGMFAYYAKWIPNFSDKIQPLTNTKTFPLASEALNAFNHLKEHLLTATLRSIDEDLPFVVECDASDVAVSAVLNQGGRPVAFMSRTLQGGEVHYPAVEKEATAIIEAVRKWEHLLARQHFTLITDQRSVAFMLDNRKRTKIKNSKILEWRVELASFSYTIKYRPGNENVAPDTLTRVNCCASFSTSNLSDIHDGLCHPGVTRLLHFVRSRNLPFSTEDVKKTCASCRICSELKPQFYRPTGETLIKATRPMERLSIDFKGPLPSTSRNIYILTVIDEYSRFPFAFPCQNMHTSTVIQCLETIFGLCGMPSYIHSDRGASFMSNELKTYLTQKGVATSRTTPYHPIGNGQCERFNGIIWKSIRLKLRTMGLPDKHWELAIQDALHSIRSLLTTATNTTPHERFFSFSRRSTHGNSLPSWLMSPGPVMLKRFVRASKNDPLVDEVELIEANPTYANIKYPNGRESTVSVRDLAPCPSADGASRRYQNDPDNTRTDPTAINSTDTNVPSPHSDADNIIPQDFSAPEATATEPTGTVIKRSSRVSNAPSRYGWD